MASDPWLLVMIETTLATSAGVVLVLMLRRPIRHAFGADAAYLLWATVPLVMLAVLAPSPTKAMTPVMADLAPQWAGIGPTLAAQAPDNQWLYWLVWAWAAGALSMFTILVHQQGRFVAGLGPLQRRADGYLQSLATRGLPAVVGFRPRIVLPGDFDQRYSPVERELVLAHEHEHLRRGDLLACLLLVLMRSAYWFNPLMHLAARRFRNDQELACDSAVLRRFPEYRRSYAKAMLKTQLAGQPLPFGCHWSSSHPLKERLAMLTLPSPTLPRRIAGSLFVMLLVVSAASFAWTAQPGPTTAPAGMLLLEAAIKVDDNEARNLRVILAPNEVHEERFEHTGQHWRTRWTVAPLADGTFDISALLERDGTILGEPRLIFRDEAGIRVGEQNEDGSFRGLGIELRVTAGPLAPALERD